MPRFILPLIGCLFALLCIPACTVSEPAPSAPPPNVPPPRVLVLPFNPVGYGTAVASVGQSIQRSIESELMHERVAQVASSSTQPASPGTSPVAIASAAGANVVVSGEYEVINDQVRVTGEVTEVGSSQMLRSIKASGPMSDLFKVEDSVADQVASVLQPPEPPNDGTTYSYAYPPPDYYYDYPYYYGGPVFGFYYGGFYHPWHGGYYYHSFGPHAYFRGGGGFRR